MYSLLHLVKLNNVPKTLVIGNDSVCFMIYVYSKYLLKMAHKF